MKSLHIFSVFAALFFAVSCDFLDESDPNAVTTGNFYTSESDIATSVNGIYESLNQGYYFYNNHFFTDVRAHATVVMDAGGNSGIPYQFYNYTLTEENTYVYNRYTQMFKTISRANKVLAHLGDVTYADSTTRDTYEAEAKFLRALTYYYLVTEWGDVPLVLTNLTTPEEVKAHDYRSPKADVYQAIYDDLATVTSSPLADLQPESECGRASKAAAWTLWGKACLQQACDEDFSSQKDALLKEAVTNLTNAWNMRTFNQLSDIPFKDIWDLGTQKGCPENIFQLNFIQGNADLSSPWNFLYGPVTTGITSYKTGSAANVTTAEVYDSYDNADVRKAYLNKFQSAGQTYYNTMKYVDLDCGANGYGGNNWVVFRYADVVLMLSEAYYWEGKPEVAEDWLNMVRKRAGLSDWSGNDLRQGIYDERLHEFMQEGLRWQDLLRMYTKEEMISHFNVINSNFSLKDLLLPIPYTERIINPAGLYQNPGYGE